MKHGYIVLLQVYYTTLLTMIKEMEVMKNDKVLKSRYPTYGFV